MRTRRMVLSIFAFCLIGTIMRSGSTAAALSQVTVTSISGWNVGELVANGRWTGQASRLTNPQSNAYINMLAVESQYNGNPAYTPESTFTIYGTNFGTQVGSVQFLNANLQPVSGVTVTIRGWQNTQVTIAAKTIYTFQSSGVGSAAWVRVSRDKNPPQVCYAGAGMLAVKGFVGVIKTRGFGQCTWDVAKRRLDAVKSIPTPSAYSTTGPITAAYVPQLWDGLVYGSTHVAIITSTPVRSSSGGTTTWTFTVTEMNALTDEKETSDPRLFSVRNGSIVTWIGSRAGTSYRATAYWR